jgi:hypothetical protein
MLLCCLHAVMLLEAVGILLLEIVMLLLQLLLLLLVSKRPCQLM